jgi:dimethyl sulfoxide reductase iron-sulfur subunit
VAGSRLTRRRVLIGLGGAAAATAAAPAMAWNSSSAEATRATARPARQWVMVIDLRRCEGCETVEGPAKCTEACEQAHFLPPGQQWIRVVEEENERGGTFFRPIPCMQCENAPCVNVCPVGATYRSDDGVVLVDTTRCIGCRFCMAACPYDARVFNWEEPETPPGATFVTPSPQFPVPHRRGTVSKCMLCAHQVPQGLLPACVEGCPMKAIYLGDLVSDVATNGEEAVRLSTFLTENNAYRYKEEHGTRPRVYYVPGYGQAFGRKAGP